MRQTTIRYSAPTFVQKNIKLDNRDLKIFPELDIKKGKNLMKYSLYQT